MTRDPDWAKLAATSQMEAEVLKVALETAEIPVVLEAETAGHLYGITTSSLGFTTILVPADRLDEARELIADSTAIDMPTGD